VTLLWHGRVKNHRPVGARQVVMPAARRPVRL